MFLVQISRTIALSCFLSVETGLKCTFMLHILKYSLFNPSSFFSKTLIKVM